MDKVRDGEALTGVVKYLVRELQSYRYCLVGVPGAVNNLKSVAPTTIAG